MTPERVVFPKAAAAAVDRRLRALGPDVSVVEAAGTRRYHRGDRLFAIVRTRRLGTDVGFYKLGRARSKRILSARGRLPFVPYLVELEAAGDVDSELVAWLAESYQEASAER